MLECIGPIPENLFELISDIAVAIELFHAAALVHDDLIDKSDSRRVAGGTQKICQVS